MKKLFLATVAVLTASVAFAADLPVKGPRYATKAPPVYSQTAYPPDCNSHNYNGNPVYTGQAPHAPPGVQILPLPVVGNAVPGITPWVNLRAPCGWSDPNVTGFFPDPINWVDKYAVPHVTFLSK